MVELIEYVVAFAVSAGVAGAGLMVVGGAMPGIGQVSNASKADQIGAAASLSVVQGRAVTLVLPLENTAIACGSGVLSVSFGGNAEDYRVDMPCSFDFQGLHGTCTLGFSSVAALTLEVTC